MIDKFKKRVEAFENKYPGLYKVIVFIISCFFVNNYLSWIWSEDYKCNLQSDDEDTKKLAGRKIEVAPADEAGPSKDKSSNPSSYNPRYHRGTEVPGPGKPSPHGDLQLRLEKMMLDSTDSFLDQANSEIRAKNLHTKDESELTSEEVTLLKQRESHVDHMIKTSANVQAMESKASENLVDTNISKRDVKSADIESDKEDIKKRK